MAETLPEQPYYFLHTLVGHHNDHTSHILYQAGRSERPEVFKIDTFLYADADSPEGVSAAMGLDLRETMCTVSKPAPAVTYHQNYGLIIEGVVRECFDNDSGASLQSDGTYDDHVFPVTNRTTPDDLMGTWYDEYADKQRFTWNEVILHKGAQVVGAFYDPNKPPRWPELPTMAHRQQGEEYELFLEKAERCGLGVLHIDSKFER